MDDQLRTAFWETKAISAFERRWQVHLDQTRCDRLRALTLGGRRMEVTVSTRKPHTFLVSWLDVLGSPLSNSDSYTSPPHSEQVWELFDQACDDQSKTVRSPVTSQRLHFRRGEPCTARRKLGDGRKSSGPHDRRSPVSAVHHDVHLDQFERGFDHVSGRGGGELPRGVRHVACGGGASPGRNHAVPWGVERKKPRVTRRCPLTFTWVRFSLATCTIGQAVAPVGEGLMATRLQHELFRFPSGCVPHQGWSDLHARRPAPR